jgi:DNA-directed RNA polymerase specialized sigma24 family protein
MDLHVEAQCIDQMKEGKLDKFLMLFDAYFDDVYEYVVRRVGEGARAEEIARLTFLDALGQVQNTPIDIGYLVWLYSLAKDRAWQEMAKNPQSNLDIIAVVEGDLKGGLLGKTKKMFGKLGLEEREILRLKFFEEVSDGDVMTVLGIEEGVIGPKIYRVLKRAHLLLFGESDERQGVYFGELSGFLARVREVEEIKVPQAFKLHQRADVSGRIDRRDLAIEAEEVVEKKVTSKEPAPTGSNDPAKIFVKAAQSMTKEDWKDLDKDRQGIERKERFYDFIDKWKMLLILVPVLLFAISMFVVLRNIIDFEIPGEKRTVAGICASTDVNFEEGFEVAEKREINKEVSDRICDYFEVETMAISQSGSGWVYVDFQTEEWVMNYRFAKFEERWKIKHYERESIIGGDEESR